MDKRPQRLAKNKTDLMPKNASCKRWDTLGNSGECGRFRTPAQPCLRATFVLRFLGQSNGRLTAPAQEAYGRSIIRAGGGVPGEPIPGWRGQDDTAMRGGVAKRQER